MPGRDLASAPEQQRQRRRKGRRNNAILQPSENSSHTVAASQAHQSTVPVESPHEATPAAPATTAAPAAPATTAAPAAAAPAAPQTTKEGTPFANAAIDKVKPFTDYADERLGDLGDVAGYPSDILSVVSESLAVSKDATSNFAKDAFGNKDVSAWDGFAKGADGMSVAGSALGAVGAVTSAASVVSSSMNAAGNVYNALGGSKNQDPMFKEASRNLAVAQGIDAAQASTDLLALIPFTGAGEIAECASIAVDLVKSGASLRRAVMTAANSLKLDKEEHRSGNQLVDRQTQGNEEKTKEEKEKLKEMKELHLKIQYGASSLKGTEVTDTEYKKFDELRNHFGKERADVHLETIDLARAGHRLSGRQGEKTVHLGARVAAKSVNVAGGMTGGQDAGALKIASAVGKVGIGMHGLFDQVRERQNTVHDLRQAKNSADKTGRKRGWGWEAKQFFNFGDSTPEFLKFGRTDMKGLSQQQDGVREALQADLNEPNASPSEKYKNKSDFASEEYAGDAKIRRVDNLTRGRTGQKVETLKANVTGRDSRDDVGQSDEEKETISQRQRNRLFSRQLMDGMDIGQSGWSRARNQLAKPGDEAKDRQKKRDDFFNPENEETWDKIRDLLDNVNQLG